MSKKTWAAFLVFVAWTSFPTAARAVEVWTAAPIVHTGEQGVDVVTAGVQLDRDDQRGLYNPVLELAFAVATSPAGTRWAFAGIGGNPTSGFGAAAWPTLQFDTFTNSLAGQIGTNILNRPGVVHLIAEDVYIDITVTRWTNAFTGARYTYTRATAPAGVPAPSLGLLGTSALALFLLALAWRAAARDPLRTATPDPGRPSS